MLKENSPNINCTHSIAFLFWAPFKTNFPVFPNVINSLIWKILFCYKHGLDLIRNAVIFAYIWNACVQHIQNL